jgi:hypothetical protein
MKSRFLYFLACVFIYFVPLIFILLLSTQNVYSFDATLAWDPNSEKNLDGYRIFYRENGQGYDYEVPAWEGSKTTCTIYNLDDNTTYCFVARAVDTEGAESGDSNETCYQSEIITDNRDSEIIIDNRDAETSQTGTWKVSGGTDPYRANSVYSRNGATFTWHFTPSQSGIYEVSMRWTAWASRSLNVPVDIEHSDGVATVYVDQQENGGQWNVQGQYYFESGTTYDIKITSQRYPSSTCADAIKVQMKMD